LAINGYPLFSPKENADIQGTLVVIRDVTQSALAEASRAEFVTHLGHELKTPLHTLMLYSEILLDGDQADAGSRIQAVNAVHDEVERLVDLVNNLLSITRIEMGSLDLHKQRTRLPDLLEDIRLSLGRAAEQAGIRLDFKLPKDINAIEVDKDLLRIAINNLVSNAIKYNNPGGSVTIEAEETAEAVLIRVRDTGLGITAEERGRIFEKFYRGDRDEIRARGGHGLGLSLTREIIDLHEGEISVESEPGHGSTFTISLWKRFGLMQKAI
jgi:signal transduction histidine kinase